MRLYGIIKLDSECDSYITDISSNTDTFKKSDNVYYTDKECADVFDIYEPFEENWDAYWLPYNCKIVEYDIYNKDGEYYYEGEEPEEALYGALYHIYKEGKLVKKYFEEY